MSSHDDSKRIALPGIGSVSRIAMFAAITTVSLVVAVSFVAWPLVHARSSEAVLQASGPLAAPAARTHPFMAFQHISRDSLAVRLTLAPLANPGAPLTYMPPRCERVDIAGGRGLCLILDRTNFRTAFNAEIFGTDFKVRHTLTLGGLLSRARVSPDGRYGAVTAFLSGHSYAVDGQFSTSTTLLDMANGRKLANLEDFEVAKDRTPFHKADFNFWGVTFAKDSNRFYATLASGHKTYLIEGDVQTRSARVLRENVECPSLSPDNTRIVFKKRVGGNGGLWHLTVLNLATGTETPLAETRSVDDQAQWLDNQQVLYGFGTDVWVVPADGSGRPRKYMPNALSPTVVRPSAEPRPASA